MTALVTAALILPAVVHAFEQADIDIFKLQRAITQDLGDDVDFYSWLGIKRNAKFGTIKKAFFKVSRKIHPDRNPEPGANERFARLNQVYKYLRSDARERYNYYLSKGFPNYNEDTDTWSYKRFRPNLFFVFALVLLVATFLEFVYLKVSAYRQRAFFNSLIQEARDAAAKQSSNGIVTSTTFVEIRPRKTFSVHADGNVYFEGAKVDPSSIREPTFKDTFICRKFFGAPKKDEDVVGTSENCVKDISKEETVKVSPTSSDGEDSQLSKGASRRRKAASRGKSRIFT